MARDFPLFHLRIPPELKDALQEEAKRNRRSLNAELVGRLERSLIADHPQILERSGARPPYRAEDAPRILDEVQIVVELVRGMPKDKREALLKLLQE